MADAIATIRVFVSSPGDVNDERAAAADVLDRLQTEYQGRARLRPIIWEHLPLTARAGFQEQIEPPSHCDIVVCLLWKRLGTRLPADKFLKPDGTPYLSGTEYEFLDALDAASRREDGRPALLVYRKIARAEVALDDPNLPAVLEQQQLVETFFKSNFFNTDGTIRRAFHQFRETAAFSGLLERHLGALLADWCPPAQGPAAISWEGSPYRGLEAFGYDHAKVFCGRSRAIDEVVDALRQQALRGCAFVLVVGMSGSGKSSLVKAGVLPRICEARVIEGVAVWRRAEMRPADSGDDPIGALAEALTRLDALPDLRRDGLPQLLARAPSDERAARELDGLLRDALAKSAAAQGCQGAPARVLTHVDQLEELFTHCADPAARDTFVAAMGWLARSGHVWLLATLRSDYYARCQTIPQLVNLKTGRGQYDLLRPSAEEIGQMIRLPAKMAGLRFEEDPETDSRLDELLRDAAVESPEALPLLEFALEQLYQKRTPEGVLTLSAYRGLGGLEGALAMRAEQVFLGLPEKVRASLPGVLRRLVVFETAEGERVASLRCPRDVLCATPEATALAEAFIAARLFVTSGSASGQPVVAISHEALLRQWPRVQEWLASDRHFMLWRRMLGGRIEEWESTGRDAGALLAGAPLAEATGWLERRREDLDEQALEFIERSRHAALEREREREEARRKVLELAEERARAAVRAKRFAAILLLAFLVSVVLAVNSELDRQRAVAARLTADRQARIARAQRLSAQAREAGIFSSPQAALALASLACFGSNEQGLRIGAPERALREALLGIGGKALPTPIGAIESMTVHPATGHVVTGGRDGRVLAWEDGGSAVELTRCPTAVTQVEVSPDGHWVVAAARDGTVRLRDTRGKDALSLKENGPLELAISPDGSKLALATARGRVTVRSFPTIGATTALSLTVARDAHVRFSPDGSQLAVYSATASVSLWALARNEVTTWASPHGPPTGAAWMSGGRLAMMAASGPISVWDPRSPAAPRSTHDHPSLTNDVLTSSRDGKWILAGGYKGGRLWAMSEGVPSRSFTNLEVVHRRLTSASFSPDGSGFAIGLSDGTLVIWKFDGEQANKSPGLLEGHEGDIRTIGWSPDSATLVSLAADGTVRRWDTSTASLAGGVSVRGLEETAMSCSLLWQDGRYLVTGTEKPELRGHDLYAARATRQGRLLCRLPAAPKALLEGSGDGTFLAALADGRLMSVKPSPGLTGASVAELCGPAMQLAFATSARGTGWAAGSGLASHGQGIRKVGALWHVTGTSATVLRFGPEPGKGELSDLALSPAGNLAAWAANGELHVAELTSGEPREVFTTACAAVCLGFDATGRRLAVGSVEAPIRIFDLVRGTVIDLTQTMRRPEQVLFDASGRLLAVKGRGGQAQFWNVAGDLPVNIAGVASGDQLAWMAFSGDGRWLAWARADGTVIVWDLKSVEDDKYWFALDGHGSMVTGIHYRPDGKSIVTASLDCTIREWPLGMAGLRDAVDRVALRNLTPAEWLLLGNVDEPYRKAFPHLP